MRMRPHVDAAGSPKHDRSGAANPEEARARAEDQRSQPDASRAHWPTLAGRSPGTRYIWTSSSTLPVAQIFASFYLCILVRHSSRYLSLADRGSAFRRGEDRCTLTARQREFARIAGWALPISVALGAVFGHFQAQNGSVWGYIQGACDLLHDPSARVRRL
jgi:hypothetical protein